MEFCLVVLDKRTGVRPAGIGETLRRSLDKLFMRAAGDQAKTVCGNMQLCVGLEAGIEGETHTVRQRKVERAIRRQNEEETSIHGEEEDKDEAK